MATISVPGCGSDDCAECSRDLAQLCERAHHAGIGQDGFFAPYAALNVRAVVKVPNSSSPENLYCHASNHPQTSHHPWQPLQPTL